MYDPHMLVSNPTPASAPACAWARAERWRLASIDGKRHQIQEATASRAPEAVVADMRAQLADLQRPGVVAERASAIMLLWS